MRGSGIKKLWKETENIRKKKMRHQIVNKKDTVDIYIYNDYFLWFEGHTYTLAYVTNQYISSERSLKE